MRIAIAGINHEALPFSPLRANSLVPSGIVEQRAYLRLRDELVGGLRAAGPLDGVCLLLHGAMLVEHIWSGEADLVREIRAALGYGPLIAARLDMHANLTPEFASKVDLWTAFRTAPHRDIHATLARALELLVRALRTGRRPRPVFVPVPLLLQGEKAMTDYEPMRSLQALARALERRPGILSADLLVGFGWADAPHSSSSVVAIAAGAEHLPAARAAAAELA